jgi:hypothetical protein
MIWSGLTKTLLRVINQQLKALEIPEFGIFGPVLEEWLNLRDPLEKGPVRSSPYT